ncbi:hypothetical protein MP213Fo_29000 [Pseudochrobactrum sp. MP213Fo]
MHLQQQLATAAHAKAIYQKVEAVEKILTPLLEALA